MNHEAARLLIGAEPGKVSRELEEHLASCPECSRFHQETLELDRNIRRALEESPLGMTSSTPKVIPLPTAAPKRRRDARAVAGWALAASMALVTVLATWAFLPKNSLAHEVVQHVQDEANSWTSDEHVTPEELKATLALAGVELDTASGKVMFSHSCPFRGHIVPHLVVSTPQGRVTVLILRYETVKGRTAFHEGGMSGVITPATRGSLAVLMQGNDNIDAVAQQVRQAVRWLPGS